MRIHHPQPGREFASIPNETLRDERLSLAARGELAYLLSLPDGWSTTADAEAKRARSLRGKRGEGRDSMRRIYAELKDAGYIRYDRQRVNGRVSTEIHVFGRPATDVPLTDAPESRMSVPPAETPEPVDNPPGEFSQVAPTYGSPGAGTPDVGTPVHRQAVRSYEDWVTEDWMDEESVGDPIADKEQPADHDQGQRQEQPIANSETRRVHDGPETVADDAQHIPLPVTHQSPATDRNARASGNTAPDSRDEDGDVSQPDENPGAHAPCPNPQAGSDATTATPSRRLYDPRALAAQQAAEARAARAAAERAQAGTVVQ